MSVFDEPLRLLSDDLALLQRNLGAVIDLMTFDIDQDTQHRIHHEINRTALNQVIDDLAGALDE